MCVWVEDADAIEMTEEALEIVFENERIKSYLNSSKILGLAGTKGQGKTFLLKVKRRRCQLEKDESVICLPKDNMVDTLDDSIRFNRSLQSFLRVYRNWVDMWKISIAFTIIRSPELSRLFGRKDFAGLSEETRALLSVKNEHCAPSKIFYKLTSMVRKKLDMVLADTTNVVQLLDRIHTGVYIFIDKIDQAFFAQAFEIEHKNNKNASYWQYSQYSLANASYDIFSNINRHIKVFYTIRQEALTDSHLVSANTKKNIEAYLISLVYSKNDLKDMFKLYIEHEQNENLVDGGLKGTNPSKAFLGVDHILHGYVANQDEPLFDYIYRHSLRRPYDIMVICRRLYFCGKPYTIHMIRHTVNETSRSLVRTYFSEIKPFSQCSYEEIEDLLGSLNTNIFDMKYMQYVCERYNTIFSDITSCNRNCAYCDKLRPFAVLCNIGLLGYLKNNEAEPEWKQYFSTPDDRIMRLETHQLPSSRLYFLHPCLCDFARSLRKQKGCTFTTSNENVIGDQQPFPEEKVGAVIRQLPGCLEQLEQEKVFVSSTIYDLEEERAFIRKLLFNKGCYPVMSETKEFPAPSPEVHAHDSCLDVLLTCRHIVCIVGMRYGGKYAGKKYQAEAMEIRRLSGNRIQEPSISLMEFFVACKNGLEYSVFVNEAALAEKSEYKRWRETGSEGEFRGNYDREIYDVINFITHLRVNDKEIRGNWFYTYRDKRELEARIRNLKITV